MKTLSVGSSDSLVATTYDSILQETGSIDNRLVKQNDRIFVRVYVKLYYYIW
ncbi:hypothetical protein QGM71_18110 [Virgibacillus sp. C22-A2]|uniref:Uncharacterized protein n=1 Tax=Virgibacillus tibetensis TaxID=3042313 RepID=A0ABU6KJA1_9BACI|nr:hypothetical protein [Virgibacillus sp. C22-A2]